MEKARKDDLWNEIPGRTGEMDAYVQCGYEYFMIHFEIRALNMFI